MLLRASVISAIVAFLSTLIGAFFQYHSWRAEQDLARYKEDFAAATETLGEMSQLLSSVMNLQQGLFFSFIQANGSDHKDSEGQFLVETAHKTYEDYFKARNDLRQKIDVLSRKMQIYIDWPNVKSRDAKASASFDVLDPLGAIMQEKPPASNLLTDYDFDCAQNMPSSKPGQAVLILTKEQSDDTLRIDWLSVYHHVITFYHCLNEIHYALEPVRHWASQKKIGSKGKKVFMSQVT